ncbi:MAG: S9 family peptidase [FCB group bacterium]|nr:S9 family peptidase [FCB group bacterium]
MSNPKMASYGSWKSPFSADFLVAKSIRLGSLAVDDNNLYWLELRPADGGRVVLVRRDSKGKTVDVTPAPYNVRSRVNEYGGGAYLVSGKTVIFSNFSDQRLYLIDSGSAPRPITPEGSLYFADAIIDSHRNRLICVGEDHGVENKEPVSRLVAVNLDGNGHIETLIEGNDFYSTPRLSPDCATLAWLSWDHPNMPWDGTSLWTAEINEDGSLADPVIIAGGKDESIFQPEWSPDGILHFISDRTGWWNLYRLKDAQVEALCEKEAEFGIPQWVFGERTYCFESNSSILCTYTDSGKWYLARLNPNDGKLQTFYLPYSPTDGGCLCIGQDRIFTIGTSPSKPTAIISLDQDGRDMKIIRQAGDSKLDSGYISTPRPIEFPTTGGKTAYALFYPPCNKDFTGLEGELPPLIVKSHGGPTSAASDCLSLETQFWTSRGFGLIDVNYGGSSGYGRAYRQRLNGNWGIVDVDDCVNAAQYLVEKGEADGRRLIIRGGSAGGYTTLCALTFHDIFRAGCSRYGVGDLETLASDSHKFESRYLDSMVGPYPEKKDIYRERSPIHYVDQLNSPVIFFQGLEDKVVPPSQAEQMVAALKDKKLPVAYVAFEGEQHGFRRAENIKRSLEAELYFYSRIFGFEPADKIEPVIIDNLPD